MDWKEKIAHVIACVGRDQNLHTDYNGFLLLSYWINITVILITLQYILICLANTCGVKETLGGVKLVLEGNRNLVLQYNYPVKRQRKYTTFHHI